MSDGEKLADLLQCLSSHHQLSTLRRQCLQYLFDSQWNEAARFIRLLLLPGRLPATIRAIITLRQIIRSTVVEGSLVGHTGNSEVRERARDNVVWREASKLKPSRARDESDNSDTRQHSNTG